MTARQQWLVVLGVVLLLAGTLAAATHYLGDELFPLAVGSDAPAFEAATLGAAPKTRTLADYRGKVLLLNVWATWCEPCRVEMPSIARLHSEFGPQGLAVVAISIDEPGMGEAIRAYAKEMGLTFEILHGARESVQKAFQVTGYPVTFVIGPEGTIRKTVIGATDWSSDANRALIRDLLGSTPPAR